MLDTFTLYCIVVATAVGGAILSWLFTWRRPEAVGARTWSLSLACLAVYFGLVVFRQHVNGFIGYSVANGVAVIGLGVMHFGSGQICRRPVRLWLHLAVAAVVM